MGVALGDQVCTELNESERLLWFSRKKGGWRAQIQDGAVFLGDVPIDMVAICSFGLRDVNELEFVGERHVLRLFWGERMPFVELSGERTIREQIDRLSLLRGIANL